MLTIAADTPVPGQEHFLVINGNDYSEVDLVEVYHSDDPSKQPACSFQAFYIINGRHYGE